MSDISFENFLAPINLICDVVYDDSIKSEVSRIKELYKTDILKNPNSISEINEIIKAGIKQVIVTLSSKYREKLKQIYSDDGIILYIHYILKTAVTEQLSE